MRKRTSKQVTEFILCCKSIPEHRDLPQECFLSEKKYWKHFSFVCASSYQLEIYSELGMEGFVNFPSQHWDLTQLKHVQTQGMVLLIL